ncbi:MAG: putative beta-glucosidase D [Aureobasidium pullulans]|nr:MAG: putative beta-glucosidase D [Aureobasidium pullulans]
MPQIFTPPGTPVDQRLPASSSEITFGLSIQYLIKDVVKKQQSFPRCFWHNLGICSCRDLDEISALDQADFRGLYYSGGHGDFDKFGPMEHSFVVKHELLTGSEAASCVVMQHIYTKRRRNLYVFKTVTKQKSLFSHPEWGIVSNEAYVLLGILKTNLQAHPNIVQLFKCVTTKARAELFLHILQMEYCDGGDLWELNSRCLKHGARMPESLVIHIFFKSLVTALAYLHHGLILLHNGITQRHILPASPKRWQTILHNDSKPENILLRRAASASESPRFPEFVLSDFGTSGIENKVLGPRGTYRYAAPEIQEAFDLRTSLIHHLNFESADIISNGIICTTNSDIWNLGKVMQEMMPEYHKVDGREIEKRQGWWTGLEEIHGEDFVRWVRKCLGSTPLGRLSARELLEKAVGEIREDGEDTGKGSGQSLPKWFWG